MEHRCRWVSVLLFVCTLLMGAPLQLVSAVRVIDHAMCRDVDANTLECRQKTSEFPSTNEWAYFWFRVAFEASDVGAEFEFRFHDPDGNLFAHWGGKTGNPESPFLPPPYWGVAKAGEVVWWTGLGITTAKIKAYAPGNNQGLLSFDGTTDYPLAKKLGEWQAEFTLNGKVVVGERFRVVGTTTITTAATTATTAPTTTVTGTTALETGTQTELGPVGLSSGMLWIVAAVVTIVVALGLVLVTLRRRAVTKI